MAGKGSDNLPATTWRELFGQHEEPARQTIAFHEQRLPKLAAVSDVVHLAEGFSGIETIVARGMILLGPLACQQALTQWCALFPRALHGIAPIVHEREVLTYLLVAFKTTAECAEILWPVPVEETTRGFLKDLAAARSSFSEVQRRSLALAAAAGGFPEIALKYVDEEPASPFEGGRVFEFNTDGFIKYIATAIARRVPSASVEPAFDDFVKAFPLNLAAYSIEWCDLLFAARAMAILRADPIAHVAQNLHQRCMSLAAD